MVLAIPKSEKIYSDNKKIYKKTKNSNKKLLKQNNIMPYIFISVVICIIGIIQVYNTNTLTTIGYETTNLKKQTSNFKAEIAELESEIAQLVDIDRIRDIATNNLGMIEQKPIISLRSTIPLEITTFVPEKYKSTVINNGNELLKNNDASHLIKQLFIDFVGLIGNAKNLIFTLIK
jgi:cell division protein FtsL